MKKLYFYLLLTFLSFGCARNEVKNSYIKACLKTCFPCSCLPCGGKEEKEIDNAKNQVVMVKSDNKNKNDYLIDDTNSNNIMDIDDLEHEDEKEKNINEQLQKYLENHNDFSNSLNEMVNNKNEILTTIKEEFDALQKRLTDLQKGENYDISITPYDECKKIEDNYREMKVEITNKLDLDNFLDTKVKELKNKMQKDESEKYTELLNDIDNETIKNSILKTNPPANQIITDCKQLKINMGELQQEVENLFLQLTSQDDLYDILKNLNFSLKRIKNLAKNGPLTLSPKIFKNEDREKFKTTVNKAKTAGKLSIFLLKRYLSKLPRIKKQEIYDLLGDKDAGAIEKLKNTDNLVKVFVYLGKDNLHLYNLLRIFGIYTHNDKDTDYKYIVKIFTGLHLEFNKSLNKHFEYNNDYKKQYNFIKKEFRKNQNENEIKKELGNRYYYEYDNWINYNTKLKLLQALFLKSE